MKKIVKIWQLVHRPFSLWLKQQNRYKWSLPYIEYRVIKYSLSIQDGRQKSKIAATKFSFFDISASDRGDFPRIIEIALFLVIAPFLFLQYNIQFLPTRLKHNTYWNQSLLCQYNSLDERIISLTTELSK